MRGPGGAWLTSGGLISLRPSRGRRGQKTDRAGPAIIYCVQGASYRGEQGHICHYHSIMESCGFDLHQLTIQLTRYYPTKVSQVWCFLGYIFCKNNNWVILKQVISQKLGRISHYSSEIGLFWRLVQHFKMNYKSSHSEAAINQSIYLASERTYWWQIFPIFIHIHSIAFFNMIGICPNSSDLKSIVEESDPTPSQSV